MSAFYWSDMRSKLCPFLKSSIEEGRHSYLKYDQLMGDGQEYTYDNDSARPALSRKYDIGHGSETFEFTQNFKTLQSNIHNLNVKHRKPQHTELTVCSE